MTAISKTWVSVADSAIDPDSPIDTALMTALRDDLVHVREWIGASYTAGAVQDHNHDGANSAAIEIGPNWLRNGNFESGLSGWTSTVYTGGTINVGSTHESEGVIGLEITSTVAANGGGKVESNEFIAVLAGQLRQFTFSIKASDELVPVKAEAVWYDEAQAPISATELVSTLNSGAPATMTIATPCVVTVTGHGLTDGDAVVFSTTGALPTGVVAGTLYYFNSTAANTGNLYDTFANCIAGGSTGRVNTSGTQSGVHTMHAVTLSPTSHRLVVRRVAAPSTARYCKVRLEVPAAGVTAGSAYFDGVTVGVPALLGGEQVFTASGVFSATWGDVFVEVQAGGGAGGGGGGSPGGGGGGGGGGGYAAGAASIGSDVVVTVGAAGATSSFGTYGSATAGGVGAAGATLGGVGGAGGTGSGLSYSRSGDGGCVGGPPGVNGGDSGNGGSASMGGGGRGFKGGSAGGTTGGAAGGYGGGGGGGTGAGGSGAGGSGGAGSPGIVIVRW